MDWVERYVDEVIRHVPLKRREEAGVILHQEIHALLPQQPSDQEVKRVLEEMGDPAVVATRFKKRAYVVGPANFPLYIRVLKIVVPVVMGVLLFSILLANIPTLTDPTVPTIGALLSDVVSALWNVTIQLIFWITLVFFLVERYGGEHQIVRTKWDVDQLQVREKATRIKKSEAGFGLFWAVVWFGLYMNADRIFGVYEVTDGRLDRVTPVFNQPFLFDMLWLFVIVVGLQIILGTWKWIRGRWTFPLATFNLFYNVVSAGFVIWMAQAPEILDSRFETWLTQNTPAELPVDGIVNIFIVIVLVITVIDTIEGYRKAYKAREPRGRKVAHM